jgi:glycogen synthase
MKILMLGWELPPHHTGGMGIVCYQLCKQLANSGADIEFILPFTANFPAIKFMKINPALPEGVTEVIGSNNAGDGQAGSTYDSQYFEYVMSDGSRRGVQMNEHQSKYTEYVSKLVKYGKYDVIHAHDWLTIRAGLAARQISGKPLIVHIHSTEYDRSGGKHGNPMVREIEYIGLHLADKIIAISEVTKQTIIREYGIDPSKIEVVHNSMEFEPHELNESTDNVYKYLEMMKTKGYKVILSAGRLTIQKGLLHLLEAMKEVIAIRPKTILLVVGPGEMYEELIRHAADLGIGSNVIFTGGLNGTGRPWRDSYRIANLFVMPSVSEPFGLTPLEAITFGTAALISKQSGVSEVLQNCLKVDFWDVDQMANQVLAVLNNQDLEDTLVTNGQRELATMNWGKSTSKIMAQYRLHAHRELAHA